MDGRDRERDLQREIRNHLDLEAGELEHAGLSHAEARLAARRALGNTTLIQEVTREMWGFMSIERLRQDLRYAVRTLRNSPIYTAVAVLSLAFGIGANTAIFSLLNAVVLRPLPAPDPQRLVQLTYTIPVDGPENWNSYFGNPQLERFRAESKTLSGVSGGVGLGRVSLEVRGNTGLAQADAFTGNFFAVVGLTPQAGRFFVAAEDRPDASAVVLSDRYWRSRFQADAAIVGQAVTLNQLPFTIVGVAPPGFTGLFVGSSKDLWVPLHALDRLKPDPKRWSEPFTSWLTIVGRMQPGISIARAQAELDIIHRRVLAEQVASATRRLSNFERRMEAESHLVLHSAETGTNSALRHNYELPLKLLLAVAGIVLLISCANVANLVLARASRRRREIALRMALGAGRLRIVRQFLTESLLLAAAGGAAALALAWWSSSALVRMISTGDTALPLDMRPDWHIFGFTAAVALVGGIFFGVAPAVRGTRVDPGPALKEGSRSHNPGARGFDGVLVMVQITLSLVLITGAGLFTRTLQNLRNVDVGYERENILMFSSDAALAGYPKTRIMPVYRQIGQVIAALPGVESSAVSVVRPIDDQYYLVDRVRSIDGRALADQKTIRVAWNAVGPGYFQTVGIPLLLGRDFDLRPDACAFQCLVINESMARQAFPNQNPLGHKLDDAEIVGVVKDTHYNGIQDQPRPVLYRPLFRLEGGMSPANWSAPGGISFEIRYRASMGLIDGVRRAVASVDHSLPVFRIKTLRAQTDDSLLRERLLVTISNCFGALALLLACLGLYGLMAYGVARRTGEIGVRMALGAARGQIVWLVLRGTLGLLGAGIAVGIPLSLWASRYAKSLLFGVTAAEPLMIAIPVAVMALVAAIAAWLPARRASRVDPMVALRYE
jgi:predicted permease